MAFDPRKSAWIVCIWKVDRFYFSYTLVKELVYFLAVDSVYIYIYISFTCGGDIGWQNSDSDIVGHPSIACLGLVLLKA